MYYFKFEKEKKLNHDPNQIFSVYEAIKYMDENHKELQAKETPINLTYLIYQTEDDEAVISDFVKIGTQYRFDYFQYTSARFRQILQDNEESLIQVMEVLRNLEKQYSKELIEHHQATPELEVKEKDIKKNKINDQKAMRITPVQNGKETKANPTPKGARNFSKFKNWIGVGLLIVGTLLATTYGYYRLNNPVNAEDLIAEERYIEAIELDPERLEEVERKLFLQGSDGINDLHKLTEMYPEYTQAQFDLAYLQQDYQKVIELKESADTVARQAQLAVAYIQNDQLNEAEKINEIIESEEIEVLIQNEYTELGKTALKEGDIEEAKSSLEKCKDEGLKEAIESIEKINQKIIKLKQGDKEDKEAKEKIDELNSEKDNILGSL